MTFIFHPFKVESHCDVVETTTFNKKYKLKDELVTWLDENVREDEWDFLPYLCEVVF